MSELHTIAQQMVAPQKGILAADESVSTATKRLEGVDVESTPENRRRYRNLFLATEGIEEYLSGVILFEETLRQSADDGTPFIELLKQKGILPGIKVDNSHHPMPNFPNEEIIEGLDGLAERLTEYKEMGCAFTKWRMVVHISDGIPTQEVLDANAVQMALYAARAQEAGLVPIVEPEVLLKGDHTIERCEEVTQQTLDTVFAHLEKYKVDLKGVVLKASMVLPGEDSAEQKDSETVAKRTVETLKETVPPSVPGVVFLSGGQEPEEATKHLNDIAKMEPLPWEIAFSYARALQGPALEIWQGAEENLTAAREEFMKRLKLNIKADEGEYNEGMEA